MYSPPDFEEIENIQQFRFVEDLTFDEKILKIIENCKPEYIWIVNDHSSISPQIITQLELLELNEDYILISSSQTLVEKLNRIKNKGHKWIPLFGTFINNNIFNRAVILDKYKLNLNKYNGTMLNFVISCADSLTSESRISVVYSDAIGYGVYKVDREYRNSWQSSFQSYLNVALWFSKVFEDLYIKTNGKNGREVKKILNKYNLLTIINLCRLSSIYSARNPKDINTLLNSQLYKNSWGGVGLFIFKLRLNVLIGLLIKLYFRLK